MNDFKYTSVSDYTAISEQEINKSIWLLNHINNVENTLEDRFTFDAEITMHKRKLKDRIKEHQNYLGIKTTH